MLTTALLFIVITAVVATLLVRAGGRRVAVGLAAWLSIVLLASASGALMDFAARPPRMFFVVGGGLALVIVVVRARILESTPRWWPIALQAMRGPIELALLLLRRAGRIPAHMTFEGRNFDILVGVTAPLVAWAVARGHIGRRAAIAWNVAGLALLFNIVGLAVTAMPGPLRLDWPGPPNTIVATVPFVVLPAVLVPLALLLHVVSLRQSLQTWAAHAPLPLPTPTLSVTSSAAVKQAAPP